MKTAPEIIEEIKALSIEIDKLKAKHFELHSIDDSEEWEQAFLILATKKSRLDTLTWVLS